MKEPTSVLVVDDNEDLVETFCLILRRLGFRVDTASDGASAVDKFKAHHFDVTLMDIIMPRMNGVEALKLIKESSPGASVILMTAYSEEELMKIAMKAGAHSVVHKPVRIDQMIQRIKEAALKRLILIVDDDADTLETMTKALEFHGYQVVAAGSGEEALSMAGDDCHIAFVDIKLPFMDGFETYLKLKQINPDIRTILMTGYGDEVKDIIDKALAASVITCLYKPFDPSAAIDLVSQLGRQSYRAGCGDDG